MTEPTSGSIEGEPALDADGQFARVYERLKAMASRRLAAGSRNTLDTTGLVHELYLRMARDDGPTFVAQAQFFAYAARAMRHLLMDRARDRLRLRAGGDWVRVTMDGIDGRAAMDTAEGTLALDQALDRLAEVDPRAARVLELRYFAGTTPEEAAKVLGVSLRSVERDWQFARAWLHDALGGG